MALTTHREWLHDNDDWGSASSVWRDRFSRTWDDWPLDWPRPREVVDRFRRDSDRWWRDWPSDWPRMDTIVPRFSSNLDRFDRNWRNDPFWRDIYPRWAEPIFKDGIDVKTSVVNDSSRFAVDIDTYQFKPEELQVKTLDDTLLIEGRHEDVRDADNYTRMHFVRKYQLPTDVMPEDVVSSINANGRLTVEARKRAPAINARERSIPIESSSDARLRPGSRSNSYSRDQQYHQQHQQQHKHQQSYDANYRPTPVPQSRVESRASNYDSNYLSPKNNGYRSEFSTRSSDANGMRHETRREEFREEIRRSGSHTSLGPAPLAPQPIHNEYQHYRSQSRNGHSASLSRNDYRTPDPPTSATPNGVHNLRPSDELGERSHSSRSESRNVRISKTYT